MYLDDAIGSDDCPINHVDTFFARLRLHKLKLSPDKSRTGAARVDEVLDTPGHSSVFLVIDLFSGFTLFTIHPDTIPLTAFCTPTGLYEWLCLFRFGHKTCYDRPR